MSEMVSSFLDVHLGKQKYLFFLVVWSDYTTRLTDEIDKQWNAFGADLGPLGTVVRAYNKCAKISFDEVKAKDWPEEIKKRYREEQDPFILVIDRDFANFNPNENQWCIIWLTNFFGEPGQIYRLFGSLARRVEQGEDIFSYVHSLARKQKIAKISKYFAIKPGIFGVSVDISAILKDIANAG